MGKFAWKENIFNRSRLFEIIYYDTSGDGNYRRRKLTDARYVNTKYNLQTVRYKRND